MVTCERPLYAHTETIDSDTICMAAAAFVHVIEQRKCIMLSQGIA